MEWTAKIPQNKTVGGVRAHRKLELLGLSSKEIKSVIDNILTKVNLGLDVFMSEFFEILYT